MESNTTFGKVILTNSVIAAAILFVVGILYYLLDLSYFNYGFMALNFLVLIAVVTIFGVIGTKTYRDKVLGGQINYGKKFLTIFLISFIRFNKIVIKVIVIYAGFYSSRSGKQPTCFTGIIIFADFICILNHIYNSYGYILLHFLSKNVAREPLFKSQSIPAGLRSRFAFHRCWGDPFLV